MMKYAAASRNGITISEMSSSSGEIVIIMITVPMIENSAKMNSPSTCWSDWPMLSMSLVVRLITSPRGTRSK